MSFDFSTLVTDRTQADVNRVKQISEKIKNGTASESELSEFNSAAMKGAYNHTDLNRVTAAMEALKSKLEGYGYAVPGYQRIKVPHPVTGGGSRLPEGYTELAWIESTGTQYIDTGVVANQNIGFELDFETANQIASSGQGTVLGCLNSTSARYEITTWTDNSWGGQLCFGAKTYDPAITSNTRMFLSLRNGTFTTPKGAVSVATTAFNSGISVALFGRHRQNVGFDELSKTKIFSCRFYDSDTLIRDFIPCINPDEAVGLYDLVTAAFFGNSGTGAFACNLDFANQTWQQIIDACQSNAVPSIWRVGNSKTMTINGTDYNIDIIGKDHDDYANGSGKAPLTFQLHELYASNYAMNGSNTNSGGWASCSMRTTHLPAIKAFMPTEVRNALKLVTKLSSAGLQSTAINATADDMFLLSEVEIFGGTTFSVIGEGNQYDYYSAGNSKIKTINGSASSWWTRSPRSSTSTDFCNVYTNGANDASSASGSRGVSFAFCF